MNIIISNLSEKKAFLDSQKILLQYIPKISSDTFAGSLSTEALDSLINALLKKASKNMSVIIRKVETRERLKVLKIIGNRKKISFNHQYVMSTSGIKEEYKSFTEFEKFESIVLKHAGLLHDLGKYNRYFQDKIAPSFLAQNKALADPFRHELLSAILIAKTLYDMEKNNQEIEKFIFILKEVIEDWNKKIESMDDNIQTFKKFISLQFEEMRLFINNKFQLDRNYGYKDFYMFSIFYLALTHHRLPLLNKNGSDCTSIILSEIINQFDDFTSEFNNSIKYEFDALDLKRNLTFQIEEKEIWLKYEKCFDYKQLNLLFQTDKKFEFIDILNFTHLNRNIFIYSDHFASEDKYKKYHKPTETIIYANSEKIKDKFERGDTLIDHLIHVGKYTRKMLHFVQECHPSISCQEFHDIHEDSILFQKSHGKYTWQNNLVDFFEKQTYSGPLLLNLICEAGSGKTIGAVKALKSLNPELRFTVCLPKRSLVFQTASVYKEQLMIKESNIKTLVGGYTAENIYIAQQKFEDSLIQDNTLGTENATRGVFKELRKESYLDNTTLSNIKFSQLEHDAISKPIVISTTDFFAHSIHLLTGGDVGLSLRLMTSDLILDELDDYKVEDYLALSRMVEFSASYGKKIIIMSATMNLGLLDIINKAYQKGLNIYNMRKGRSHLNSIFYMHNFMNEVSSFENKDFEKNPLTGAFYSNFEKYKESIINAFNNNKKTENKKHNIYYSSSKNILDEAIKLHDLNKNIITINKEDRLVSFGFINCKTVKTAQQIWEQLKEDRILYQDYIIHPLCIHSKFPTIVNAIAESELKTMMNNHRQGIFTEKFIEAMSLNYLKKEGVKDVLFVVVGTSFLETGRDLDFDYTIIDLKSVRSYIQTLGRVRRHRAGTYSQNNVCLMTAPFDDSDFDNIFKKPGLIDYKRVSETKPSCMENFLNKHIQPHFDMKNKNFNKNFFQNFQNDSSNKNLLITDLSVLNKNSKDASKNIYALSVLSSHVEFSQKDNSRTSFSIDNYYETHMRFYKNFYKFRRFRNSNKIEKLIGFEINVNNFGEHQYSYNIYHVNENGEQVDIHGKSQVMYMNDELFYLCKPDDILKMLGLYQKEQLSTLERLELFGVMIPMDNFERARFSFEKGITYNK